MESAIDARSPVPGVVPDQKEVHVWHFGLTPANDQMLADQRALLDREEQARADRFIRSEHAARFTVGRATVRLLLATYLNCDPAAVRFSYSETGKPHLDVDCHAGDITFNVSHSGAFAVCAVARSAALGIDIEEKRANREFLKIARRYFAPQEVRQLLELPDTHQLNAFYQCWTGKEALIKAWGCGLSAPLDCFSVRVAPGETALLALDLPEYAAYRWHLQSVPAAPDLAASLAVRGEAPRVRSWRFQPPA